MMRANTRMKLARRQVERGAAHLADAASELRALGYEEEARSLSNAAYEAAIALGRAEHRHENPESRS